MTDRPHDDPEETPAARIERNSKFHAEEFLCLGFDRGIYYYLPRGAGQVLPLKSNQHVEANLISIAPLQFWEQHYAGDKGVSWKAVANALIQRQHAVGIYSTARVRGRGAWWDRGQAVVHVGDRLLINGKEFPLSTPGKYIYERSLPYEIRYDNPLSAKAAYGLIEICKLMSWEHKISAYYAAGFIAIAPIAGALEWRPHVWITGPADSGKSWFVREVVQRIISNKISINRQSCTTEPAIRGALSNSSQPVILEEAESKTVSEKLRMDAIVGLARAASTQDGNPIGKANSDGTTREILINSSFLFCSISYPISKPEDVRRITPLSIVRDGDKARFSKLEAMTAEILSDETCSLLPSRSIRMIPVIRHNARVFGAVLADNLKSSGLGQQYGTLLAGAWSLFSDSEITAAAAKKWIDEQHSLGAWQEQAAQQGDTDEVQCLARIRDHIIRAQAKSGPIDRSVAELCDVSSERSQDEVLSARTAGEILGRYGLRGDPDGMVVAVDHAGIAGILRGTPWERNWARTLRRLPGAHATEWGVRFGSDKKRGIEIPWPVDEKNHETA